MHFKLHTISYAIITYYSFLRSGGGYQIQLLGKLHLWFSAFQPGWKFKMCSHYLVIGPQIWGYFSCFYCCQKIVFLSLPIAPKWNKHSNGVFTIHLRSYWRCPMVISEGGPVEHSKLQGQKITPFFSPLFFLSKQQFSWDHSGCLMKRSGISCCKWMRRG